MLDGHGQPVTARFNSARNVTRDLNELIGLCKGVLIDNEVTQQEAEFLIRWIHDHQEVADHWPVSVLYPRLKQVLEDGVLDSDEAAELLTLLQDITGDRLESINTQTGEVLVDQSATVLPLNEPEEDILFSEQHFVLTGKFASGTRKECEAEVLSRGGYVQRKPTKKTRYVVIGTCGSRDWAHAPWGRKIQHAMLLREEGQDLNIISEERWAKEIGLV
ncbi:MAG: BRCT domain-containing protein [Motiliproteus sp.]|nr:BRCT domain-containing protein [Motiliproteus sp.]MCW9051263.1 BRCT domain-containing protein [Motiliproteus sp.]